VIDTDYLVVGAGAAGMSFTDAVLTHSDATVTIVDRRHAPGGHWVDAYPFVRLHQPSAFYGVASVPLGKDAIDRAGLNAGFYEMAGADELRAYYLEVMQRHFLPTARVRFLPCTDYAGAEGDRHRLVSRLTGQTQEVRVQRKLVDTTYLEGSIPATGAPPFEVGPGVRLVPAGGVTDIAGSARRFCVIGAGKTALDTCVWLLSQGVAPAAIRWIKPREGWWLNRRHHQPHALLPDFYAGAGLQMQAMADATSIDDLFARLEAEGFFLRVDRTVPATMLHGAIASESEVELLRRIEDVVRLGRVRRIERDRIVLEDGEVPTDDGTVHVHCAAEGLRRPPLRPIFEPGHVTVQPCYWGFASFQFALLGVVECLAGSDEERNGLCRPIRYWDRPEDYLTAYLALLAGDRARAKVPAVAEWAKDCRLNPLGGLGRHRDHPTVVATRERIKRVGPGAVANVAKLLAATR
jgi:hypothetical protein